MAETRRDKTVFALICLALALMTLGLYWPATHHEFINLDDPVYITENPHIQSGLTADSFRWAFQIGYAAYWHPVTWLSHMMDCQMFGLNPGGHHLVSILFHIANTLLLFIWLKTLTGAMWRSAFVAALFAWHPLHVESVAWACERKDVLSTFFWLLTLMAYVRYAQGRSKAEGVTQSLKYQPSMISYFLALIFFTLGLMSKPMIVTLPCVLLLLDFWPLKRIEFFGNKDLVRTIKFLLIEKIPFFVLIIPTSIVTYFAQKGGGAVWSEGLPLTTRISNSLVSYSRYLGKSFWPENLCVMYPYPKHWPALLVIGSALLLVLVSAWCLVNLRRKPYLAFGWLWFVGTFVPVIGLVQVGPQAMADRFSYVPSIGLFILISWGAYDLFDRYPARRMLIPVTACVALVGCLMVTSIQINYWQNSVSLFLRALHVTNGNYIAENCMGRALDDLGQKEAAISFYTRSVGIDTHFPQSQFNLGMDLWSAGRLSEACENFAAAVRLAPDNAEARYFLGTALMENGKLDESILQFNEALRLKPDFAQARRNLDKASARRSQN